MGRSGKVDSRRVSAIGRNSGSAISRNSGSAPGSADCIAGSRAWQTCCRFCSFICGGFKARLSGAVVFDGGEEELTLIECLRCTQMYSEAGSCSHPGGVRLSSLRPRGGNAPVSGFGRGGSEKSRALPRVARRNEAAFSNLRGLVFLYQTGGSYGGVPRPAA